MRKLLLALSLLLSALVFAPAQAAVSPTPGQILKICPDNPKAKACPGAAEWFLSSRPPSETSDGQIVSLAVKIVEDLKAHDYPLPVCLDAADGLRVLAKGMLNGQRAEQLAEIADTLCEDSETNAIGDTGPKIPPTPHSIHHENYGPGKCGEGSQAVNCGQQCDPGYHQEGRKCVPDKVNCDEGEHGENGVCVPDDDKCPIGTHPGEEGGCFPDQITCGPGEYDNGEECVPEPTCTGDQVLENHQCILDCDEGEYESGNQCRTDPVCEGDEVLSNHQCVLDCAEGQYESGSYCVEEPVCEGDEVLSNHQCVLYCAEGQYESGSYCVEEPVCEGDEVLQNHQCVLECSEGYYESGSYCVEEPICGDFEHLDDHECVPDDVCPQGYIGEPPSCFVELVCDEFTHQEGNKCVPDDVCPSGYIGEPPSCYEELTCDEFEHQEGDSCVPDTSVCINPAGNILPITSQACQTGANPICSLINAGLNGPTCPPVNGVCGAGGTLSGNTCVETPATCVGSGGEQPGSNCTLPALGAQTDAFCSKNYGAGVYGYELLGYATEAACKAANNPP